MRLPRDIGGEELARSLSKLGYLVTRQTGSHLRLATDEPTQHHITIPRHRALRVGTLSSILEAVAEHRRISRPELMKRLFE